MCKNKYIVKDMFDLYTAVMILVPEVPVSKPVHFILLIFVVVVFL
jgi:hypothetical protein